MKVSSFAMAMLTGALVYLGGSLAYSHYGAGADQLAAHATRLRANVADLERIHAELVAEIDLLRADPDAVALHARSLGYYRPGEQVVRIEGYTSRGITRSPGTIVRRANQQVDGVPWVRYAAIAATVLVLFQQLAGGRYPMRRHSR